MDEPSEPGPAPAAETSSRAAPACKTCGEPTRFVEGVSTHDLYAERFVCEAGHDTYRSFGRGSVS